MIFMCAKLQPFPSKLNSSLSFFETSRIKVKYHYTTKIENDFILFLSLFKFDNMYIIEIAVYYSPLNFVNNANATKKRKKVT